jgi:hypothetical protein
VVGESRVRRGVAELADTAVGCFVPRMKSRIREGVLWTFRALRDILSETVVPARARRTQGAAVFEGPCRTVTLRLTHRPRVRLGIRLTGITRQTRYSGIFLVCETTNTPARIAIL